MIYNLPLPDYVCMGEDRALSSFPVSRNPDVEGVIRNNVLICQKSHNATILSWGYVMSNHSSESA